MSQFEDFGLSRGILRAISDQGYSQPTPIQAQAIPAVLQKRDLMAGAQTGTGKTAGFTLPMLQRLIATDTPGKKPRRRVRALVLTPTRELANQVYESVRTYGHYLHLRAAVIYGGVSMHPQTRTLRQGVDILVATPGRLLDHVGQGNLDLSHMEILVLDEADRMLDMGFLPDIKKVMDLAPPERQNLLFSATFSKQIKQLAEGLLKDPLSITVAADNSAAERVNQIVHPVERNRKRDLITHLLQRDGWEHVLVFTRTKHSANRLVKHLDKSGFRASAIHGDKTQHARMQALNQFKTGQVKVLVATDIAARGLDIDRLPYVVNYELPDSAENYIHRIGRTGRAGNEGTAVSLVCREERRNMRDIERLLKAKITQEVIADFAPESQAPISDFKPKKPKRKPSFNRDQGDFGTKSEGSKTYGKKKVKPSPRKEQGDFVAKSEGSKIDGKKKVKRTPSKRTKSFRWDPSSGDKPKSSSKGQGFDRPKRRPRTA
jgi:ATP-dependent RNA helicase RhlE